MRAIFLSDAHLRSEDELRYQLLLKLFDQICGHCDHLYLVGDFFDFWFCSPDRIYPEYVSVISKLKKLQKNGTRIHLCEGNHDFYLESYFGEKLGMEVFTEWADMNIDGKKLFIAHGDTVDRGNIRYLALRKVLRSRLFYHFQWLIPTNFRWKIASLSSDVSKGFNEISKDLLIGKMEKFSVKKIENGYDAVILGHCHKPLIKHLSIEGRDGYFVSLGDWVTHFSYLSFEHGEYRLQFYQA